MPAVHSLGEGLLRVSLMGRQRAQWAQGGSVGPRAGPAVRGVGRSQVGGGCPHIPHTLCCRVRGGPSTSRKTQTLDRRRGRQSYRGASVRSPQRGGHPGHRAGDGLCAHSQGKRLFSNTPQPASLYPGNQRVQIGGWVLSNIAKLNQGKPCI